MAIIQNTLKIEIYPTVQDVCEVISAVTAFYPAQEIEVLEAIQRSIEKRIEELKKKDRPGETVKEIARLLYEKQAKGIKTTSQVDQQF